jgi:hypothetical protein
MAPTLQREGEALMEYTELFNARIARKADALADANRQRLGDLRAKYGPAIEFLWMMRVLETTAPPLPLRSAFKETQTTEINIPDEVLDAVALRPFMEAVSRFYATVTLEFDSVFGERA